MTHSFLIVGGTKKKREQEAVVRASPEETIVKATRDRRMESEESAVAGTFSGGGEQHLRKGPTPPRVDEGVARKTAYFDTTILKPEEDKRVITIDQIRKLQHQLSLKPYASKVKTGIILEAQRMTVEAQNALLKTLEEPPAHSILILTAPSTKNLLPTIVSRCQIIRLRPEIDLEVESEKHQRAVEEFLKLLRSGRGERLAWVENNNKPLIVNRKSLIDTLDVWISVLRDLLLINSNCPSLTLNPLTKQDNSSTLCSVRESTQTLATALEQTIKTKNLIASTNISPRLALEVLLLDLPILTSLTNP